MYIDYAPTKDCLHPDLTFGEICVQCNDCERFTKALQRFDVTLYIQSYDGVTGLWSDPTPHATYCDGIWMTCRGYGKRRTFPEERSKNITDVMPAIWINRGLDYVRMWIEGRRWE